MTKDLPLIRCPSCGNLRTEMGTKPALIGTTKKSIRIKCSRCQGTIRMN